MIALPVIMRQELVLTPIKLFASRKVDLHHRNVDVAGIRHLQKTSHRACTIGV